MRWHDRTSRRHRREIGHKRQELVENEIEGREVPRSSSERDQRYDMEKVGKTEMIRTFHKLSAELMEMYCQPRVTEEGKRFGLRTGAAVDLTTGWDFRRSDHGQKATENQKEHKPQIIIGSPVCVMFSQDQNLSLWSEDKQRMGVEAKKHVEFMCEIYAEQARCRSCFVHQHPVEATSWKLDAVEQIFPPERSRSSVCGSVHVRPPHVAPERQGHARTEKKEGHDELS